MEETTPTPGRPSVILTLHARYEETWEEYHRVESAKAELGDDTEDCVLRYRYEDGMKVSQAEADALRLAILLQVPVTWPEALVLSYHVQVAYDLRDNAIGNPPDEERAALSTAIDTLFDFLCCEVQQDHETLGKMFQTEANRAFFARRYRTGVLDD